MPLIRPLRSSDRAHWEGLWNGYPHFYRQRLPSVVTNTTFTRLIEETQQPHGLVAEHGDNLVGFAHNLFHASSWSLPEVCNLKDLFVDAAARGGGVGRILIQTV